MDPQSGRERKGSGGANREHDSHEQATIRGVRSGDGAFVQTNRPLGDGQADASAARLAVAGVGHPVEWEKQLGQGALGNARA